jgi:GAF domain-containing protein
VGQNVSPPVEQALARLDRQATVPSLLHATAQELVELLEAERCAISRAVGELLVEVTAYQPSGSSPQLDLYLASDYPLTQEVLDSGEPRTVSIAAPDSDAAETELLVRLGFSDLLMLPLSSGGSRWGLVEVYATDRPFTQADVATARPLLGGAEAILGRLAQG